MTVFNFGHKPLDKPDFNLCLKIQLCDSFGVSPCYQIEINYSMSDRVREFDEKVISFERETDSNHFKMRGSRCTLRRLKISHFDILSIIVRNSESSKFNFYTLDKSLFSLSWRIRLKRGNFEGN